MRTTYLLAGAVAACAFLSVTTPATAQPLKTVEPGVLTVAFSGDMPGTGWQDGRMTGYDGEVLERVARALNLKIKPALMEWSGTIASVQSGRVDIMAGTMGWTAQRAKIMTLSDPIQYFKNGITQTEKTNWTRLKDLENKKVGTITGFSFIPELRKLDGLTLSLYDTSDAAVRDLLAGRIDAVIGDPPVMQYALSRNPDWKLKFNAFEDNDPKFPLLTGMGQVVFGMNKDSEALASAVNAEIAKLWKECAMRGIGKTYGLEQDVWYVPQGANARHGVDRPESWSLPACP
ncbi:putative solute-binding component of ABC transporter [plant metagenome]|uniref:Putative solute-binding component of ABC transporter n=1 Tax=plant metagenome TaxID=1297885 RepID=A0A484QHC3_9ZZZZ